jgi:hypothetical protein
MTFRGVRRPERGGVRPLSPAQGTHGPRSGAVGPLVPVWP